MKTRHIFSAAALMMLMAACQKEEMPEAQGSFAPEPSDRCGCLAPAEMEARNATDETIDLNWNNMPEAIAYRIEVADEFNGADAFGTIIFNEITEGTRITVTRLAPNTKYQYRITSICGNDESSPSAIQTFVTGDFRHGDPDYRPNTVRDSNENSLQ